MRAVDSGIDRFAWPQLKHRPALPGALIEQLITTYALPASAYDTRYDAPRPGFACSNSGRL
jgi:hypothetical protein